MISFKHTLLRAALFLLFGAIPFSVLGQGALNPSAGPAPLFKSLNEIQPRTAVAGGGATTISQPGSYYLTGNITVSSGNGITVSGTGKEPALSTTISSLASLASKLPVIWTLPSSSSDWTIGAEMRTAFESAVNAAGIEGITTDGIDPMWLIRVDDPARQQRFLELAAANGVLFKRGAYNFAALAHDEDAIREMEAGASSALVALRDEEAHG